LRLHVHAPLDQLMGWTVDYGDVKELFAPVYARLDHQPLNELSGIDDNDVLSLTRWICGEVAPQLLVSWGEHPPALPV
jgi:6-pyruvoyltetrahydropterin/6-carboxytetrahydropterin synthase